MTPGAESSYRLFVAWPVPRAVGEDLHRVCTSIQRQLPRASWVRPEAYHLTFAFIGNQMPVVGDRIVQRLPRFLTRRAPVELKFRSAGFFSSAHRPGVGWVGVSAAVSLVEISDEVGQALTTLEIAVDERGFNPHLTLVRMKAPWSAEHCQLFQRSFERFIHEKVLMDHISLIRSELGEKGSRYTELASFPF